MLALRRRALALFLSDDGPMLETLDYTIRIGSTPTFLYFDLYLYSAYAAHYVYLEKWNLFVKHIFESNLIKVLRRNFFVRFNRTESWIFKSRFHGWDDVLQVDFTRTAETVSQRRILPVAQVRFSVLSTNHIA